MQKTEPRRIKIKPIKLEDSGWIIKLMNQKSVRKNSFNQTKISEKENLSYWKKKLNDKKFKAFKVLIDNKPVGIIRVDNKKVSIAIDEKWQGKGIAFYALNSINLNGCYAEIRPDNTASIKLFKKLGFREQKRVFAK